MNKEKLYKLVELIDLMVIKLKLNPDFILSDKLQNFLDDSDLVISDFCDKIGFTIEELDNMSESDITRYNRREKLDKINKVSKD